MKRLLLHCLLILSSLSGCTVSRYYYVAEEKIDLYEFPSFSGDPVLTALPGDTVSATGTEYIQLGGKVPVEYAGYSFYSPSAKARFLRIEKVRRKKDAMVPGIAYAGRMRYNAKHIAATTEPIIEDNGDWYGQVTLVTPILNEPYALSRTISTLPPNTIVTIRRHNYNYWEVEANGRKGYVGAFYILDYSHSASPFVKTAYTGRTYHPDEVFSNYVSSRKSSTGSSNHGYTPSTGAAIHVGPRGGQYYINSRGNKTYLSKSSPYRIGGSYSTGSSYRYKSSSSRSYRSSGSSYRSSGTRSYSSGGRGRR